jgi:hypothetical protein
MTAPVPSWRANVEARFVKFSLESSTVFIKILYRNYLNTKHNKNIQIFNSIYLQNAWRSRKKLEHDSRHLAPRANEVPSLDLSPQK